MSFKSVLLKLIFMVFIAITIEYHKKTTGADQVVNVRNIHKLQARSLLFPSTAPTRVQFIGGIGIPVEDLHYESVTSGYVLKAEYFLPETAEVFHQKIKPQKIHRRRRSVNETELYEHSFENVSLQTTDNLNRRQRHGAFYRWIVYKAVETILNKSALNGHICMLRSICEHAAIPLNYEGGLLAEILHIILTPSTSRDELFKPENKNYLRAEILGRSGENCAKAFNLCTKSPMDIISAVFET